ncbi:MAG: Xaa-Pro aminopeptidase pepP [Lasallia pustulata]|nr:MAG: Xaa-Pro aminopeptidase pepP [Lasallia pustulata]
MDSLESVLAGKYPAKAHAAKVAAYIKNKPAGDDGVIYLESQKTRMIEDNDEPQPFRQRRYFYYLSGCALPDCYLTYDTRNGHLTLFIPPIDPEAVIWSGLPLSPAEALQRYDVDAVQPSTEIDAHLTAIAGQRTVWVIQGQVSDHGSFLAFGNTDFTLAKEAIEECRVVKDNYEITLTRKANAISTVAHTAVLKKVKNASNERELEAVFLERCVANGCREQAYHSIVASGRNAATLHYQKNNEDLAGRWNLLLDAGGEYGCYAADITRTFPIGGKFNRESRQIYDVVLRMQKECMEMLKEGVVWDDVHARAHEIAIEGLLELGILRGNKVEIFEKRTSVAFFPHGLGHYLGMDTHDTGGHPNYEDPDSMFRYLRVRGKLPAGSIITVEPGVYFCRFIIDPYLKDATHSKYIDETVLNRYWDVGGVRIEDNVLITASGFENLTTALKEVEDMEKVIRS